MLSPFGPKPVREAEEVFLIDGVEHRNSCALDDFVFQRSYSQRALFAVSFGYEYPSDGLCPVCAALNSFVQVMKVSLQLCLVVLPRDFIYPGGGMALERQKRLQK